MTVSIDVDLNARSAHVKLGALKAQIKELEDNIDLDFDLDLDGDIGDALDDLTDSMDELSESFNSDLNETIDRLEGLDVNVAGGNRDGRADSSGDTGRDSGDYIPSPRQFFRDGPFDDNEPNSLNQAINKAHRNISGLGDAFEIAEMRLDTREYRDKFGKTLGGRKLYSGDFKAGTMTSSSPNSGSMDAIRTAFPYHKSNSKIDNFAEKINDVRRGVNKASNSFKKAIPNMQMWWSLIAAAIPALGAMAVQAIGVAAALGAVALAGASMVGLGLLGDGDTMAESFRNAGEELDELKKGLFESFEPTADLFSGIQSEFFDFIPGEMDRIAQSMEGFTVFKDDLFSGFRGLTMLISDIFDTMVKHEGIISNLAGTFGSIISTNIIKFFEWLLFTTSENKQMLINLGGIFKDIALGLYEIFMVISKAIIKLEYFFLAFKWIAGLLNNSVVSGMVAIITSMLIVNSVIGLVTGSLGMLATLLGTGLIPLFSGLFTAMSTWLFQTLTQTMANYGLAASIANVAAALGTLMAMSGIGLLVAGAGLAVGKATGLTDMGGNISRGPGSSGSSGGYGSGGGTVINEGDNVNVEIGNADNSTLEKFKDMGSNPSRSRSPTGGSYTSN